MDSSIPFTGSDIVVIDDIITRYDMAILIAKEGSKMRRANTDEKTDFYNKYYK